MGLAIIIDLLQIILLAASVVAVMVIAAFRRDHALINALTLIGLAASLLVFFFVRPTLPLEITPLLMIDQFGLFFSNLIIAAAMVASALAYPYFQGHNEQNEEFYILLLIATLGAVTLACSSHFASFFLGMEILGISLYAMIAYPVHAPRPAKFPLEASIKYLILSGLGSALLLFGAALLYSQLGTLKFAEMPSALAALDIHEPVALAGFLMVMGGIAFKLSLVPFHIWTPDVYEGAPAPVAAYLATVSKAAMLAVFLRLLLTAEAYSFAAINLALVILATASMLIGNLLALLQRNVKRLLAYSSIAHVGYLLVVVIAALEITSEWSMEALGFYLFAYFLMSLAAFGVISALSTAERELDEAADYQGLFWRRPWLSSALIAALLSLAGIPLTAGFIGKFYIFAVGVEGQYWFLLTILIIGSALGLYYYLRLIYIMLQAPASPAEDGGRELPQGDLPLSAQAVVASMTAGLIYLGVYPEPAMRIVQSLAGAF